MAIRLVSFLFSRVFNVVAWVEGQVINATDPSGKYFWTGRGEELLSKHNKFDRSNVSTRIQLLVMSGQMSVVHAEYPIPLASIENVPDVFSANVDFAYIDLVYENTGEIWEIKPFYQQTDATAIAQAQVLMMNQLQNAELLTGTYPTGLPYDWNDDPSSFILGSSFSKVPVYIGSDQGGYYSFYAQQGLPGSILWWRVKNRTRSTTVPNPILVPGEMLREDGPAVKPAHPGQVVIPKSGGGFHPPVTNEIPVPGSDLVLPTIPSMSVDPNAFTCPEFPTVRIPPVPPIFWAIPERVPNSSPRIGFGGISLSFPSGGRTDPGG